MSSSICFMPASLTPQSLPPGLPTMSRYCPGSTVVMCMRAGLYQTKNGLLVLCGSLRSRKSMTFAEISSSMRLRSLQGQRTLVLAVCFVRAAVGGLAREHRTRWVRQIVVFASTAPGPRATRGSACFWTGRNRLLALGPVDVGEAHPRIASR